MMLTHRRSFADCRLFGLEVVLLKARRLGTRSSPAGRRQTSGSDNIRPNADLTFRPTLVINVGTVATVEAIVSFTVAAAVIVLIVQIVVRISPIATNNEVIAITGM